MDVSENSATPKSSILIGFSIVNHPFWSTPIFGNTHVQFSVSHVLRTQCFHKILGEVHGPQLAGTRFWNHPQRTDPETIGSRPVPSIFRRYVMLWASGATTPSFYVNIRPNFCWVRFKRKKKKNTGHFAIFPSSDKKEAAPWDSLSMAGESTANQRRGFLIFKLRAWRSQEFRSEFASAVSQYVAIP